MIKLGKYGKALMPKDSAETPKIEARDVEIDQLMALSEENHKLRSILEISKIIVSEIHLDNLLQLIIKETTRVMDADRSSLFLIDYGKNELWSKVAQGLDRYEVIRFPMGLGIAGTVAATGEVINIPDAYQDLRFNKEIDAKTGYRTHSILCMPIQNTSGKIIGVIQVLNKKTGIFTAKDEDFLEALTSQAGIALENASLYKEIEDLFEEIVTTIVTALDARDRTTAGHTKRVALYTLKIAKAIHNETDGVFASYRYTLDQFKRLRYASLLHDIGKIGINENILNKVTRLSEGHMMAIIARFRYYQYFFGTVKVYEFNFDNEKIQDREKIRELMESFVKFLEDVNQPTRMYLNDQERDLILKIRDAHFINERREREELLSSYEYIHLSIPKGNLTEEERDHIRSHVAKSFTILNQIRWPEKFEELPLIAASHHEYLDGSGYPKGLKENEIPLDSKIMAIADFYDALTARDRPYKPQVPHDKAVAIMKEEAQKNKIDGKILDLFLREKLYLLTVDDYMTHGMEKEIPAELHKTI